jgi:hypothetical protein
MTLPRLLLPTQVRSLDAIHLATSQLLGDDLAPVVTYDDRMTERGSAAWASDRLTHVSTNTRQARRGHEERPAAYFDLAQPAPTG